MTKPPLERYLNRRAVYIEGGTFCLVTVEAVETGSTGMRAVLSQDPDISLVCHYREDPVRFADGEKPFGDRWEISKEWNWFYYSPDHWDGSPYGGFHLIFSEQVIDRYLARDMQWVEDYF
jgi:hypothetical protein